MQPFKNSFDNSTFLHYYTLYTVHLENILCSFKFCVPAQEGSYCSLSKDGLKTLLEQRSSVES